jgi:hypothetical protein
MADWVRKPSPSSRLDTSADFLLFIQLGFVEHIDRGFFLPCFPIPDLSTRPQLVVEASLDSYVCGCYPVFDCLPKVTSV